jgi:hypothetical protein
VKLFASVCAAALIALGMVSTAGAQQTADGLVVVQIQDVDFTDVVDVNVAANVAAQLCGIDVGPLSIAVLGQAIAVDRSGRERTICEVNDQTISIENA